MGCNNSTDANENCQTNNQNNAPPQPSPPLSESKKLADLSPATWEMQALNSHNTFRAKHGVPPLVLDAGITRTAQAYAKHLAKKNLFEHSSNRDNLGENLYTMSSSAPLTDQTFGTDATQSWYDEIKYYDFNNPDFSMETGHFTQLVWKSSSSLGVGVGFSDDGKTVVVVAQYGPAGNMMGAFEENVPPPQ
ncbi:unnamed protein product [Rotaria socialis]|uniref:SCP domain-containing protein n=1 Tax=Rotaria socialis TaxID=392032 RepID=A0A817R173_9BILA|nr:unnamed protein product [Rotaria socialis]CAF3313787.1 unnamed protein product [Rotaria socialis]CAF4318347.1 unnamed protein product [Rotaria socialis]CAF4444596.1 unnamed protein product [Rotaria socialis]